MSVGWTVQDFQVDPPVVIDDRMIKTLRPSKETPPLKDTGEKARGRGGKFGRWRTLKNGRRVFISGGVGGASGGTVYMKRGDSRYTKLQTGIGVDPDGVDRLLHDFEAIPDWATRDISSIEMTIMPGPRFTAGGESFETGMDYTDSKGRIRIFRANENLSPFFANDDFYHEVGHSLQGRVNLMAQVEIGRSGGTPREWYSTNPRTGMQTLKPEHEAAWAKRYPMGDAMQRWTDAWVKGEDGVTSYSKAWAKEGSLSYDETFAELSQIYLAGWSHGGKRYARQRVHAVGADQKAPNLAAAFVDIMDELSRPRRSKSLGDKAKGRGGKYGRWRTLKNGRRVLISGGLPKGRYAPSLFVNRGGQPPPAGTHIYAAYGADEIDGDRFDRFLHDFETLPNWATRDIEAIELDTDPGYSFTAGGENFTAGGDYNHSAGKIRVFRANSNLRSGYANTLLYHEVGHNLERRFDDLGKAQFNAAHKDHADWFRDDGEIHRKHRKQYRQDYPFGDAWQRFHIAWIDGEDGVTPYSKSWAKEGKWGETWAEMTEMYFKDGWSAVTKAGLGSGAGNLAQAFNDAMTAFSKGQDE